MPLHFLPYKQCSPPWFLRTNDEYYEYRLKICQKAAISKIIELRAITTLQVKFDFVSKSMHRCNVSQFLRTNSRSQETQNLSKSCNFEKKKRIGSESFTISSCQIELWSACRMERLMRVKQPSSQEKVDSKKKQRTRCQAKIFKLQVWILLANFPCFTNVIDQEYISNQFACLFIWLGAKGREQGSQLVEKGLSANCRQLFALNPVQPGKQSTYLECQKQLFQLFFAWRGVLSLGGVY